MNVLVTGGCGYIGHYAVKRLLDRGDKVIVVDDLSTGYKEALEDDATFYEIDIVNYSELEVVFKENKIDLIVDFAAKLIVDESFEDPSKYYENNVIGLKNILDLMNKYKVKRIIFSSTAAVYGNHFEVDDLIEEDDLVMPINPYGETKLVGENMIKWYANVYDFDYVIFRYFNVVGGMKPGSSIDDFTTIFPRIIDSILNGKTLKVFGGDYDTKDGTCIRDYIHVYDLIEAHILTIDNFNYIDSGIYNLSTGQGASVFELIFAIGDLLDVKVNYKVVDRRVGDPMVSVASNKKILSVIDWDIKYMDIKLMLDEAYSSWK